MSSHSVAEANERFPEPVEFALRGEPVGATAAKSVTPEGLVWLRTHRIEPSRPQPIDAATLIRRMRE
jgi:hypothetical protein